MAYILDNMQQFDVPVALFIFKRSEKAILIINQIAKIAPKKIYLIGDGPRNESEREDVEQCRANIEKAITWDCEIIRNYSNNNRGVFNNIAGGAKWVFAREKRAIFLEDDNFPEITFFRYCKELLDKYENDSRVLWICGTNYLESYEPEDGADYVFTKLMLPCGWASWSSKFVKFYDGDLNLYSDPVLLKKVSLGYKNKILLRQNLMSWEIEHERIRRGEKPISWDFQMAFSLRVHGLYGIAPKYNQIRNIGIDIHATHGTGSAKNTMVKRFCEIPTHQLSFPLKDPKVVLIDNTFERKTEKIIILPWKVRLKSIVGRRINKIMGRPIDKKIFRKR